jgi:hypothetical protein
MIWMDGSVLRTQNAKQKAVLEEAAEMRMVEQPPRYSEQKSQSSHQ